MKQETKTQAVNSVEGTVPRYRVSLVREAQHNYEVEPLSRPEAVADFLFDEVKVDEYPQERMLALFVDSRGQLIGYQVAFVGGLGRATVEPRAILQAALLVNAEGIILSHNHPSGDPSPSTEDVTFTRRMKEAAEVIGLTLIDHLVTGESGKSVSLRARGAI